MTLLLKKILVTCALPYANGQIHIGHLLEHIQADIWVRYLRMIGHTVWFVCADDAHGTAILLNAEKKGILPEELIDIVSKQHKNDFLNFNISYDNYHSTHTEENHFFCNQIYNFLKEKKLIREKNIVQLYDSEKKIFLPDRFIKGICPFCNSKDQYGDYCERCGSVYSSIELLEPVSIISGSTPILRNTIHLFFNLPYFDSILKSWIHSGVLQDTVVNKTKEWFKTGLKEWDISRDSPYFGFKIPNYTNKFFYVWLDATIGYISSFKNLANKNRKINFDEFWKEQYQTELYHFIGKDIIYFHTLFWPAILEASNLRKPTGIFVHGHVTINGKKISKSKGSLIKAKKWLKHLDADSLRYYYATKLSTGIDDIEINLNDFMTKINSDIVNNVVNLGSRSARFINVYFHGKLFDIPSTDPQYVLFIKSSRTIEQLFENRLFSCVVREIMKLSDNANQYINFYAPWQILKNQGVCDKLQYIASMGINLFRIILTWLKPIMPSLAKKSEKFLNIELTWNGINNPLVNHTISNFKKLYTRIQSDDIQPLLYLLSKVK